MIKTTYWKEFIPKSWTCLKQGYTNSVFLNDLFAGIAIGIISLPLTMAFAIGSGLSPEKGLFTGIVAGFIISLLGGSRVQIGGPTGAFMVIVYSVVERHGYEGLAMATFMAGFMILALGLLRAGVLLKFIPYPVTVGFTSGIALTLFSNQIKDFLGLPIAKMPVDFLSKWTAYFSHLPGLNPWALALGGLSLLLIAALRVLLPKIPAPLAAVFLASFIVEAFQIPVATIWTRFGDLPTSLPLPSLGFLDMNKIGLLFPDACSIALLGSIESLLSAVVADGMTGHRHRSNVELLAQGLGNLGSVIFGGIPATGAIARTAANIKFGAKTPLAGMTHAITLLALITFFAPWAAMIPLPALAAVLMFVAWNMSEIDHVRSLLKAPRADLLIFAATFGLTVLVDLTVAFQGGLVLSALFFMKNLTSTTSIKTLRAVLKEEQKAVSEESDALIDAPLQEGFLVFEIDGPLFFGNAYVLQDLLQSTIPLPQSFEIRFDKVPLIDASGLHSLETFCSQCEKKGIGVRLTGLRPALRDLLQTSGLSLVKNTGLSALEASS